MFATGRSIPARLRRAVNSGRSRAAAGLVVTLGLASSVVVASGPAGSASPRWVASWAASMTAGGNIPGHRCPSDVGLKNQTVRNIVYVSVGGRSVRVRVSNAFGSSPLVVGRVTVALAGTGAATTGPAAIGATFAGQAGVTIPAGSEVFTDPIATTVNARQHLAVSIFVPGTTGPATQHFIAAQTNYVSKPGNWAFTRSPETFTTEIGCSLFLSGVDVSTTAGIIGSVVALGDSITDGIGSTYGADNRWPNILSRRLNDAGGRLSVVDAAIIGNQILKDGTQPAFGPSALSRLDRDGLGQTAVRDLILFEGINDIGAGDATASQIIQADQTIIARAHARGVRVFAGTLTPFTGSHDTLGRSYGTPTGETTRQAVNQWIRTSGAFDGVIDFDAAVGDPSHPSRLNPAYDSGDHMHPNDTGYQAMAAAVDLAAL